MSLKCSLNPSSWKPLQLPEGLQGLLGCVISSSLGCEVSSVSFNKLKSYFMQLKISMETTWTR